MNQNHKIPSMRASAPLNDFLIYLTLSEAVLVEIGSYAGESTESFAKSGKFKSIIAVDPWLDSYVSGLAVSEVEKEFDSKLSSYPFVKKMKMTSLAASKLFEKESIDIVYIDAVHTYECVKDDILAWSPIVRKGGLITGHDYSFPGVKKAVDELLGNVKHFQADSSWLAIK